MITIKQILKEKEKIIVGLKSRNFDISIIDKLYELGITRNRVMFTLENFQKERNALSKEFGIKKSQKLDTSLEKITLDKIKKNIDEKEQELVKINKEINNLLFLIPNIPHKNTPIGKNEDDNVEDERFNDDKIPKFKVIPHYEIIAKLDIVDNPRAVKMSGTRFTMYKGKGAQLARALYSFYLDENIKKGYIELSTPVLVNSNTLKGTGQLPKFSEDLFKIENKDLWLIPTAEVSITNYFSNEIIDLKTPKCFTGFTECFRSEAGSAGKDIKGIIRLHEFKKVELVKITSQDQKEIEYKKMLNDIQDLLLKLELPFRKLILCTGDLGFSSEYTIDFEVWLPSENRYLEVSSASMFSEFQARRMMIRYKDNGKNKYASTINGSGLPIERLITVISENYQTEDGHIKIPKVLQKYLTFDII